MLSSSSTYGLTRKNLLRSQVLLQRPCCLNTSDHHHPCLYSPSGSWPPLIRFLNHILNHTLGLPGRVINPSQGLCLRRTTQHRKTKDKHPCPERDSNQRSSVRALKSHVSDRAAAGSAIYLITSINFISVSFVHFWQWIRSYNGLQKTMTSVKGIVKIELIV
jgi:hypothetical protein